MAALPECTGGRCGMCGSRGQLALSLVLASACAAPADALKRARPWGHLVEKHEAAQRSRRLTNQGAVLRGLDFVMSGYDIYFGNPSPTLSSVDPGFRSKIFATSFSQGRTTTDGRFELPDGMTALSCDGSCSLASKVQSIAGAESYRNSLSSRVSVAFGILGIASFAASFDYQRVEAGTTNRSMIYTQAETTCCVYKASVATFSPPPLTANFLAAVDFAPVEYDQRVYFEIIAEFGTHFVSSADMGGFFGQETAFTRDEFQRLTSASFDWMVAAEFSFLEIISFNFENSMATARNESREFRSLSQSQRIYSLGQRPPRSGDPADWLQESIQNPMPTAVTLRPLDRLFARRSLGDVVVPNLTAKQSNMERALREYCEQFLLPARRIRSCQVPTGDVAPPSSQSVCLASIPAGGGPGGEDFDDNTAVIVANGLNAALEIREISYRAARHVDNIQVHVGLGERRFPLGAHGGNLGDPGKLLFSQGQKIISVQVAYERYINRLSFFTSDGAQMAVGSQDGNRRITVNFRHRVSEIVGYTPDSAWAVGLFGRSGKYLDNIGFHVAYTCREDTTSEVAEAETTGTGMSTTFTDGS